MIRLLFILSIFSSYFPYENKILQGVFAENEILEIREFSNKRFGQSVLNFFKRNKKENQKTNLINSSQTKKASENKTDRVISSIQRRIKKDDFQKWTQELREIQKKLTDKNFKRALNLTVCPQLEKLEKNPYRKTQAFKIYFRQLIKFYGSITRYTLDHNYYYCLASFLNDPEHKLIVLLADNILAQEIKTNLLDRLSVCYEESSVGNGDVPSQALELTDSKSFSKMNETEKNKHSQELRDSYLNFEKSVK